MKKCQGIIQKVFGRINMKNISSKAWPMLAVSDMQKSRHFYEKVMEQEVESVSGDVHTNYKSGFTLQCEYDALVGGREDFAPHPTGARLEMKAKSNNFQIYFEIEDLNYWRKKLKAVEDLEIIHDFVEYNWGQRVMRFYDPDGHIIELREAMEVVIRRHITEEYEQGRTVEELADHFAESVENIRRILRGE